MSSPGGGELARHLADLAQQRRAARQAYDEAVLRAVRRAGERVAVPRLAHDLRQYAGGYQRLRTALNRLERRGLVVRHQVQHGHTKCLYSAKEAGC